MRKPEGFSGMGPALLATVRCGCLRVTDSLSRRPCLGGRPATWASVYIRFISSNVWDLQDFVDCFYDAGFGSCCVIFAVAIYCGGSGQKLKIYIIPSFHRLDIRSLKLQKRRIREKWFCRSLPLCHGVDMWGQGSFWRVPCFGGCNRTAMRHGFI